MEGLGSIDMDEKQHANLAVVVIDLGENNLGTFGPVGRTAEDQQVASEGLAAPEYSKRPTNRWICVDGRVSADEMAAVNVETNEADPQIGGGIAVSETAAAFMEPSQNKSHGTLVAEKTQQAISDNIRVTVHGDNGKGKEGCKANTALRDILRFNGENMDIVAPKAWAVVEALGVSKFMQEEDVTESIIDGAKSADTDELWDVAPDQVVDIIVENGGEYIELLDAHEEWDVRAAIVPDAFAKAQYVHDHRTEDKTIEAFSASFGEYARVNFERAAKHSQTERDAALQVLRVVLYNIGLTKQLISDEMATTLIVESSQA